MEFLNKIFTFWKDESEGIEPEIRTLREGDNRNYPKDGDIVRVHYQGFLVSSKEEFDDSYRRAEKGFKFEIGKGKVIKCWDKALRRISLGEKAKVFCDSRIAYGNDGIPGRIPKNEDLIFYIELQDIYREKKN